MPPDAVNVDVPPEHTVEADGVIEIDGTVTVTVTVPVEAQPVAFCELTV